MTKSKSDTEMSGNVPDALGYLGKAWEWTWSLRGASLLLFADIYLNWRNKEGLLAWKVPATDTWVHSIGELALGVVSFSLVASLGLPVLADVIQRLLGELPGIWPGSSDRGSRPLGYVSLLELRDHANEHESIFALQVAERHEEQHSRSSRANEHTKNLVFGMLVLGLCDSPWLLPANSHSLIGAILDWGTPGQLLLSFGGIGAIVILRSLWFAVPNQFVIRYLPLEAAIKKKRDASLRGDV